MCANGGGEPGGSIGEAIKSSFGSYDAFAKEFKAAGATQFGSGWAWLVTDKAGKLKVTKSPNAETPIVVDEVRASSL
jgi:superoxide dismutase, Fe-Mn family